MLAFNVVTRHWQASQPACLTASSLFSTRQLDRSPVFVARSILQMLLPAFTGCERIKFKLAVIVYRALHGTAPQYLSDRLQYVADLPTRRRGQLCSSRRVTVGDRSFAAAGPRLWNSLPADVQSAPALTTFRQKLKTNLFRQSYPDIVI